MAYQFSDSVQDKINQFLSNSVVTTSIVVGSIFFAGDQLFWMKKLPVGSSTYLIWNQNALWDSCIFKILQQLSHFLIPKGSK